MKAKPPLSSRSNGSATIVCKLVSVATLIVLLMNCRAPDDASPEVPAASQARYSVDVRLSLKPATTTSQPPEADLRPFHSKDGEIDFTEDGRIVKLYAYEATDVPDKRILQVWFNPPFRQPVTATADDVCLQTTGASGSRFLLSLGSGPYRITNDFSYCSGTRCAVSGAGTLIVKNVHPLRITFKEVRLYPKHRDSSESLVFDGFGRWEQTAGAPVYMRPLCEGQRY